MNARDVLDFWFREAVDPEGSIDEWNLVWFGRDEHFDAAVRERFALLPDLALRGDLDAWVNEPQGALALAIALDQFPRNLYRGTPRCFAYDQKAQKVAELAVERGYDQELEPVGAVFLYMPFEHAEDIDRQERSVELFRALAERAPERQEDAFENYVSYAERHHAVIARFGRFPHRNEVLERTMTAEERDYLASGGDAF